MAIETASYVSDLNVANPPGSDPVGQVDDHIRLIKSVLKATFPNITGPITANQLQLNQGGVPTGSIVMWSGSIASVPTGWALCNGQTAAKVDGSGNVTVPDLRDKFIVGAGSTYAVAATGGATSNTPTISVTSGAYTLTKNDLPAYSLTVTDNGHTHTATSIDSGHSHTYNSASTSNQQGGAPGGSYTFTSSGGAIASASSTANVTTTVNSASTGITVSSGGGGASHSHSASATSSSVATIPPYYALAFIYKL